MQGDAALIVRRLRDQRRFWVEVAPGLRIRLVRPTEREAAVHLFTDSGSGSPSFAVKFEDVVRHTDGWEGFTEALLLGAAVGSSDPLPFDAELWGEVAAEHLDWVSTLQRALLDKVIAHLNAQGAEAKN